MSNRKKNYRPRRRKRTRWQNYSGAARQLARDVRLLKQVVNTEFKHLDSSISVTDIDYSGDLTVLNNPAQGLDDEQRVGDSIKVQKVDIRCHFNHTSNCVVRLIVFWDQCNTINSTSEFLEYSGSALAVDSFKDNDNRFLTKVLYDRVFNINTAQTLQYVVRKTIHIGKHTQFDEDTTTINTGALKLIFVSDQAPTTNVGSVGYARVYYTDN